jgi:hypothetical protein
MSRKPKPQGNMTRVDYLEKLRNTKLDDCLRLAVIPNLRVRVREIPGVSPDDIWVIETLEDEPGFWVHIAPTREGAMMVCNKLGWSVEP